MFRALLAVTVAAGCLLAAITANAAPLAIDFTGVATSRTGVYSSEVVAGNIVSGTMIWDSSRDFSTLTDPFIATNPLNLVRILQSFGNVPDEISTSFAVEFGSITLSSPDEFFAQTTFTAVDSNPFGADDQFSYDVAIDGRRSAFQFVIEAEDLYLEDPIDGLTFGFLSAIDFGSVISPEGLLRPGAFTRGSISVAEGSLVFDITGISAREVTVDPVGDTVVPVPASALFLLTALAGVGFAAHQRRRSVYPLLQDAGESTAPIAC